MCFIVCSVCRLGDEVNAARARAEALLQSIANAVLKAQNLAKNATILASRVTGSPLRTAERMAPDVKTGRNIPLCVVGQSEGTKSVAIRAGTVTY
jgi:hypothetical protein